MLAEVALEPERLLESDEQRSAPRPLLPRHIHHGRQKRPIPMNRPKVPRLTDRQMNRPPDQRSHRLTIPETNRTVFSPASAAEPRDSLSSLAIPPTGKHEAI